MRWKKLGIVYGPDGRRPWAQSHAMLPTPVLVSPGTIRVFVTFCDEQGIGRPGFVDVSSSNPMQVLRISDEPLLELGRPGTFDENGMVACSVVDLGDGRMYMYYVGFEIGTRIRYRLLTGLAVSRDGGESFERYSETPVLERSPAELFFRCGPYCVHEGGKFRMWYVAGSEWMLVDGKQMPVYDIRYIESDDGVRWPAHGEQQICVSDPDEHGFGRPFILRQGSRYRMFYSVRRRSLAAYRLGYAESQDGRKWTRCDERMGLDVGGSGFDSQAIMYAAPFEVGEKLYVFYNGNDFGRDGFGLAVQEEV